MSTRTQVVDGQFDYKHGFDSSAAALAELGEQPGHSNYVQCRLAQQLTWTFDGQRRCTEVVVGRPQRRSVGGAHHLDQQLSDAELSLAWE